MSTVPPDYFKSNAVLMEATVLTNGKARILA